MGFIVDFLWKVVKGEIDFLCKKVESKGLFFVEVEKLCKVLLNNSMLLIMHAFHILTQVISNIQLTSHFYLTLIVWKRSVEIGIDLFRQ